MTNNTDPLRALIGEMTDYLDQEVDPELDVIEQWRDRLEAALASAPPSAPVGVKRWPFVESPGEFTERLAAAMQELPLIGAVRHVLIENPPALAQQPAAIPRLANCGKYTATDNNGQHYYLNHANTWQTFQGQQPAAPSGEAVASDPAYRSGYAQGVADSCSHECDCGRTVAIAAPPSAPAGVDAKARRLYEMIFDAIAEDGSQQAEDACIRAIASALSQQPAAVDEFAADRERLLRAFMMECGIIGAKEAGVNLARGIKAALAAQQQGGRADG